MTITPLQVLIRSSLVCALVGAVIFGLAIRKIERIPVNTDPLHFKSQNAYHYMHYLSKKFPNRVTWSEPRAKAALWLKDEFKKLGYEPKGQLFSEVIGGKQYSGLENIYAEKRGTVKPEEIIIVAAHYDITDTTIEGAMDDASGVGVVLELARVFAKEPSDRTLLFLLTDSEEFGAFWGARSFLQSYDRTDQIIAVANFDFVSAENQTRILTLCDGLKTGYTPLWLRELALDSLRSLSLVEVLDLTHFVEFVERAMQIPPADHGAFLAAGVPAFNWVGQTSHFAKVMAEYHHTTRDVAEAMKPESFEPFGKGAERLIRSINQMGRLPIRLKDSSYWKISKSLYVEGWAVVLLNFLFFIPFLAYSTSRIRLIVRQNTSQQILNIAKNEAKNIGIVLGSLLLGYSLILVLPYLKIITQYETFPATQKSLILYNPNFTAIFLVIATVVCVYALFRRIFAEPDDAISNLEIRRTCHAAFLALVIFLAFLKNSYLAVLLLLPPAYFWAALKNSRRPKDRIMNLLLILCGSTTFVITLIALSSIFHVGVVYWYIFLAAAYGLFSAYSVILFFMALTVMIRLIRSFVI